MGESQKDSGALTYEVMIQPGALKVIQGIGDARIRAKIRDRIDGLSQEPEKQGKPLVEELAGFRSLRAAGQRYRILYRIERAQVVVVVVAARIRKQGDKRDIYAVMKRLLRLGLLS